MIFISWTDEVLTLSDPRLPETGIDIWYIEAFCRNRSRLRAWEETVIPHKTVLIDANPTRIHLRSTLADGVIADHEILAGDDAVSFEVSLRNPTAVASEAHWAQPCIRVADFTGVPFERASERYLPKSFVFIDGALTRMPVEPWSREGLYTPGQVWRPEHVDPNDVNPRPLNRARPSNGLIGCYSADERLILATAWEPYQELFQGVSCCLHSDFRIGGLLPGERKRARGMIYLMEPDIDTLVKRYQRDLCVP